MGGETPKHEKGRSQVRERVSDRRGSRTARLPDKIPRNVHTLFVGINPGKRSAKIGHYYGGHSNYFWKLLTASGIWPDVLDTYDDDQLVRNGFGLTDVVKRPTTGVSQLTSSD